MSFVWTENAVRKVAAMLHDGETASRIGAVLGITRNSVIGKVRRDKRLRAIGFKTPSGFDRKNKQSAPSKPKAKPKHTTAPKPFRQKRSSPRTDFMVVPKAKTIKPVPTLAPDLEFHCEPVTSEVRKGCMWIVGDVAGPQTLFCNEPKAFKSSWCEHHYRRVFQPARERA